MLTLDQVRAVNDGFCSGDLSAALRPLEETVDLRQNELPRLDKAALARLKTGLAEGDNAATWAEAAFHPNVSLRRFVRRVFMGLGDEAAPLAEPLRARIERFWNEETPLEWSTKPREAAARREQNETLGNALELFLRADPEGFVGFWAQLLDSSQPRQNETAAQAEEWRKRSQLAAAAQFAEVNRLLEDEWGKEWLESDKRWKLPSRVLRELDERARQNPEVARLQAEVGDVPWQRAALEWQPAQLFGSAVSLYLAEVEATAPKRRVAGRIRPVLQGWIEGAFDFSKPLEERRVLALRLSNATHPYHLGSWLGREWVMETLLPLLLRVKPAMLDSINRALKASSSGEQLSPRSPDVPFNTLWVGLVQRAAQSVEQHFLPYYQAMEAPLPASLSPALLRELAEDLKTERNRYSIASSLENAAKLLEKERAAKTEAAPTSVALDELESRAALSLSNALPEVFEPDAPAEDAPILQPNEALSSQQIRAIHDKDGYTPEAYARLNVEVKKAEAEIAPDKLSDDEKVARLVEPPPHPRDPNRIISRMPYWKVWTNRAPEGALAQLRERVWKRAEPQLWARLEQKLEEYRRAETDPVEEKIEKKLSERELKTWKTDRRREKRGFIAREISDIEHLLVSLDGLGARLRVIELKDRPSCRDLRDQSEGALFQTLVKYPGEYRDRKASDPYWQEWRLGPEWDALLEKLETRLGEAKDEWRVNQMRSQLATGYYRRGNFDRFAHFAALPGAFPGEVAAATLAFDDFEAWRVLTGTIARWGGDDLHKFWQEQLKIPERRARALEAVVEILSATSDENVAKSLLLWLSPIAHDELEPRAATIERALESSLVPVKRWALTTVGSLGNGDWNRERAAEVAGEALWNESAGLVKDAAKFLSQLAVRDAELAPLAWESLCDATALENLPLCEAVWKALAQIKAKNKALVLTDAARERLDELASAQSDRFGKFSKKFASS